MGAVITTRRIADRFANGMEFFSTTGGSTVACAVGNAVLDVIEGERLVDHAADLGTRTLAALRSLLPSYALLGDVRGQGMMIGVECVNHDGSAAAAQATYIASRLKDKHVLVGTDGLEHNVLKIRGPLCLTSSDIDMMIDLLADVLGEDGSQPV
jgi:4-aminobutyrate aminotransferase-like enzyme